MFKIFIFRNTVMIFRPINTAKFGVHSLKFEFEREKSNFNKEVK